MKVVVGFVKGRDRGLHRLGGRAIARFLPQAMLTDGLTGGKLISRDPSGSQQFQILGTEEANRADSTATVLPPFRASSA